MARILMCHQNGCHHDSVIPVLSGKEVTSLPPPLNQRESAVVLVDFNIIWLKSSCKHYNFFLLYLFVWLYLYELSPLLFRPSAVYRTSHNFITNTFDVRTYMYLYCMYLYYMYLYCMAWPVKQQCSTRGLPPAWLPNGINPTVQQCPGYDAVSPSPSFGQQFSASGDMQPSPDY